MDYDDLKMCNCADCGRELVGRSGGQARLIQDLKRKTDCPPLPPLVWGHILDRPYCRACLETANSRLNRRTPRQASKGEADGDNPGFDKATRDAEVSSQEDS